MSAHPSAHSTFVPQKDPRFLEALRLQTTGNAVGARDIFETLLHEHPESADLQHATGTTYLMEGRPEEAAAYFKRAVEIDAHNPRYALHLATAYRHADDMDGAVATLQSFLKVHPGNEQLFTEFFNLCMDLQRWADAEEVVRLRYKQKPDDMLSNMLMAIILEQQGKNKEKLPYVEFLYQNTPNRDMMLYINYSKALRDSGRLADAVRVVDEACVKFPNVPDLLSIKAAHAFSNGDHAGSLALYEKALSIDPANEGVRTSVGMMKMMLTDLAEGYEDYASRPNLKSEHKYIVDQYPLWRGEPLAGKKLLLWTEQGVGDIVMFASLIPWLTAQGAQQIMVLALGKMIPLLKRSYPDLHFMADLHVISFGPTTSVPPNLHFDYQLPMGDLLQRALPHYTPYENPVYLKADESLAAKLRKRYEQLTKDRGLRRIIGISWHSKNDDNNYRRNIPLAEWGKLLEVPGILWVSLQYGDFSNEIAAANKKFGNVIHVDPEIDGYADPDALAAQMRAMDEVVSIQNATVHMAGALGVSTTIMLNAASDWRWGLKTDTNRWYKSVNIERQSTIQEWQPVLARIAERLKKA